MQAENGKVLTMGDEKDNSSKVKGALARAQKLSPERRSEIAKQAANARHNKQLMRATHTGEVNISGILIPCFVLDDGTRLISYRGMNKAFDMTEGGAQELPRFLSSKAIDPFISNELRARITNSIRLSPPHGGNPASGLPATVLAEACDVWLRAREAGVLTTEKQHRTAKIAEILTRGLATIGIIALIDEATGYQAVRPKDALQEYLQLLVRKELAAWAKKFPDEFYENIYKLKSWNWPGMGKNRFSVVAHYTNDLVYKRIGPGLLEELQSKSPKTSTGNRKHKLHQWLTDDVGNPMLAQHVHAIIMFQRLAISNGYGWNKFLKMVDSVFKRKGDNLDLPFTDPTDPSEP
jgi:hypothetical protein